MRMLFLCLSILLPMSAQAWAAPSDDQVYNDCKSDDPNRAIPACKALIASGNEPNNVMVFIHGALASSYFRKGLYDDSIREYDIAIDLDVDGFLIYEDLQGRSISFYATCRFNDAIADINRNIELKSADARNYFNRGLVYLAKGDIA